MGKTKLKNVSEFLNLVKYIKVNGRIFLGGPLRFPKVLVFWLRCDQNVLDKRITDRMEKMVQDGLKEEITQFYQQCRGEGGSAGTSAIGDLAGDTEKVPADTDGAHQTTLQGCTQDFDTSNTYEDGILQAIGFKEFHDFISSKNTDDEVKSETLFRTGLDNLKRVTIRYSKKQIRWVRNRFLGRPDANRPPVYELDATHLPQWRDDVLQKSLDIAQAFLSGGTVPFSCMDAVDVSQGVGSKRRHECDECDGRVIMGDMQWTEHLKSKKHRANRKKLRKLAENEVEGEDDNSCSDAKRSKGSNEFL